jgi:hypothetical protein
MVLAIATQHQMQALVNNAISSLRKCFDMESI